MPIHLSQFGFEESGAFVKATLLEASRRPEPVHHPEYVAQFDEDPSWGTPAARIQAAQGLITLGRHAICLTPDVLDTIEMLSDDQMPSVHFQIASSLHTLRRTAPELMWKVMSRIVEKSRGVLQRLLVGPFHTLAGVEPDRIALLTKQFSSE